MSKRNKLSKFEDIMSYPNVYQNFSPKEIKPMGQGGKVVQLKGKWAEHFGDQKPIT